MIKDNNIFSIKRLLLLLRKNIVENWNVVAIAYAATIGLFIFIMFLISMGLNNKNIHPSQTRNVGFIIFFFLILFLFGFYWASRSLTAMYRKNSNQNWLMTPASPFERITESYLVATVFQIITAMTATLVAWLILALITSISFGFIWPFISMEHFKLAGRMILIYISIMPVFLMCSSIFKRAPFFQFFLWSFIISTAWTIMTVIYTFFLFGKTGINMNINFETIKGWGTFLQWAIHISFYFLFPAFCLAVSYFKIKEVESQDAI